MWKRNTYCRENFLTPISKYYACYLKKKKKKTFTLPSKENPGLLSPPQSPWGPTLDSLWFANASLVLGAPSRSQYPDVDPQRRAERIMPSPDLLYALWPAQPSTGQTFTAASGPAHHTLGTQVPSSITLLPSATHPFFPFSTSHMDPMPQICHMSVFCLCPLLWAIQIMTACLYEVASGFPLKTNSFWKHLGQV